jgi:hypothetical protein
MLSPKDLTKTSSITLGHYDQRAEIFWRDTRDHDVHQNLDALLRNLVGNGPFTFLTSDKIVLPDPHLS